MNKDLIITLQTELIQEYKIQQIYFNKIFMDIIRLYKGRLDLTEAERKLFDFSWTCNDLMVDNTKLYELSAKIHKLIKDCKLEISDLRQRETNNFKGLVGKRKKPLVLKY